MSVDTATEMERHISNRVISHQVSSIKTVIPAQDQKEEALWYTGASLKAVLFIVRIRATPGK